MNGRDNAKGKIEGKTEDYVNNRMERNLVVVKGLNMIVHEDRRKKGSKQKKKSGKWSDFLPL